MAVIYRIDLEWIFRYFPDGVPFVIKVNILMTFIFFVCTVFFVSLILCLRLYKNIRSQKKEQQRMLLEDVLNSFLFDEDFGKDGELESFEKEHLNSSLQKKVAIKEILLFHSNLKGESAEQLQALFLKWKLDQFCVNQLASRKWYSKSRAVFSLSKMLIDVNRDKIVPLLNHDKDEVRQQAQLYFVKLAKDQPLLFMAKLKKPLTLWEEIFIEDALRNEYHGPIPDFSEWINSPQNSVAEFAVRMIAKFNQFENISVLLEALEHPSEKVRKEAIKSLYTLEYIEVIEKLIAIFEAETPAVKKEILEAIKRLADFESLILLKEKISDTQWALKLKYYEVAEYFMPENKEQFYKQFEKEKARVL